VSRSFSHLQPPALVCGEPGGVGGLIRQIEEHEAGEDDGRNGFHNEQPLPAGEPSGAVQREQQARDRRADHGRKRDRGHEVADDAGAVFRGEPQGQIKDDAGKEAGFGDAQQHADQVEGVLAAHAGRAGDVGNERHQAGQEAPAQHDARNPFACAEALQQQVRRHLEQEIGEEENAGAKAESRLRQAQILIHRQRGKADIDAVQIGDEVADDSGRARGAW
jgi:hypothetical protein